MRTALKTARRATLFHCERMAAIGRATRARHDDKRLAHSARQWQPGEGLQFPLFLSGAFRPRANDPNPSPAASGGTLSQWERVRMSEYR